MGRPKSELVALQMTAYQRRQMVRENERRKRARLRAELEQEMHTPLTPGVRLSPKKRAEIRDAVTRRLNCQALFKASGFNPMATTRGNS